VAGDEATDAVTSLEDGRGSLAAGEVFGDHDEHPDLGVADRVGLEAAIPVVGPSVGVYAEVFDFNWLLAEGEF
jgi:hypothetical protein